MKRHIFLLASMFGYHVGLSSGISTANALIILDLTSLGFTNRGCMSQFYLELHSSVITRLIYRFIVWAGPLLS